MRHGRSSLAAALLAASVVAWATDTVQAPEKPVAPDLEFLEYLGTLESEGANWTDVVNVELPRTQPKPAKTDTAARRKPHAEAAEKTGGSEK